MYNKHASKYPGVRAETHRKSKSASWCAAAAEEEDAGSAVAAVLADGCSTGALIPQVRLPLIPLDRFALSSAAMQQAIMLGPQSAL